MDNELVTNFQFQQISYSIESFKICSVSARLPMLIGAFKPRPRGLKAFNRSNSLSKNPVYPDASKTPTLQHFQKTGYLQSRASNLMRLQPTEKKSVPQVGRSFSWSYTQYEHFVGDWPNEDLQFVARGSSGQGNPNVSVRTSVTISEHTIITE